MQPLKQLAWILENAADREHYLFSLRDLRGALPEQNMSAFKSLIARAEKSGLLRRVCRGLYLYPKVEYPAGQLLYHAAARLRANEFNYLSLESVLSDAGIISQVPMNWITVMSSGRSNIFDCGSLGHIEFIHTKKSPAQLASYLTYDPRCHLWRASVALALRDMKLARRDLTLVDWEAARELV